MVSIVNLFATLALRRKTRKSLLFHAPSLQKHGMARHFPVVAAAAQCAGPQWLGTAWRPATLAGCQKQPFGLAFRRLSPSSVPCTLKKLGGG